MQIGCFDFDIFAHVGKWTTVRKLLILSLQQLNLATVQLDYTAAFPQIELEEEVYAETP